MSKRIGLITLVAFATVISFPAALYAGAKQDCVAGIKEVEEMFVNEKGMGGGGKKLVENKLQIAKDASKNGKNKKCLSKISEMKKIMRAQ